MRGQSRTITRLSNENSELQGKLDLAQRKISKLLELAQLDVEDDIENDIENEDDIEDEDIDIDDDDDDEEDEEEKDA